MIRFDHTLSRIEGFVIFICYTTLIALVGVETVRRMITGNQVIWAPEIALYAFIWLSWFAMAEHIRNGTQLSFTPLRQRLAPRYQIALELLDCLIWLSIGTLILAGSISVISNNIAMHQTIFGTAIPLAAASLAVPMGWAFGMARVLQRMVIVLRGETVTRSPASPARQPAGNQNSSLSR